MERSADSRIINDINQIRNVVKGSPDFLILCHHNPDPDTLSSAFALQHLFLKVFKLPSKIVYSGNIGRAENRQMVKKLEIRLYRASRMKWSKYKDRVALVDTQPGTGNNALPEGLVPRLVFDHHPRRKKTEARFIRIEKDYGASATIMTEYLLATGPFPKNIATALAYGISSETQDLGRGVCQADLNAYLSLLPFANLKVLSCIKHPSLPKEYFVMLNKALSRAFICRQISGVHIGAVENPDIIHEVADLLVRLERCSWSLVTGRYNGQLIVSVRSTNVRGKAGIILRKILGKKGVAGGHDTMAGGVVNVSQIDDHYEDIENTITDRFIKLVSGGFTEPKSLI
ncbi:MAG: DHH family phosphoesterase [Candidatus Theseobacter exili]|nr:DHH family phosphoesterase [Candidatus Theseobacter exili]